MKQTSLEIVDWGELDYDLASARQQRWVAARMKDETPDRLILVEHPPTVTIGRRGGSGDLLLPEKVLLQKGVRVLPTDRGGRATFHGPGQMVAYPILKLKDLDLHQYVHRLLKVAATVLREYGLEPEFKDGKPGIWVCGKKIASIGIAVKKRVTFHGIALNVNPDLEAFKWIVPCGHHDEIITSMGKELLREVDVDAVKRRFVKNFKKIFAYAPANPSRHPRWLTRPAPASQTARRVNRMLDELSLHTVCNSANCPNMGECFGRGTATFMIMGDRCTRNCRFCAVKTGTPQLVDTGEPERVAQAVRQLGLNYVVVTSVTRDDLSDGGAGQFANTMAAIRRLNPETGVEVLVPDFKGCRKAVETVCSGWPDVFNHNIETVPRLYEKVRPQALFDRSLAVLAVAAARGLRVKSGLMLGLGETSLEITETLTALLNSGCEYLTLGQYLAPSPSHAPVERYLSPQAFDEWAETARLMGFKKVAAGPLVRSSYQAERMLPRKEEERSCA